MAVAVGVVRTAEAGEARQNGRLLGGAAHLACDTFLGRESRAAARIDCAALSVSVTWSLLAVYHGRWFTIMLAIGSPAGRQQRRARPGAAAGGWVPVSTFGGWSAAGQPQPASHGPRRVPGEGASVEHARRHAHSIEPKSTYMYNKSNKAATAEQRACHGRVSEVYTANLSHLQLAVPCGLMPLDRLEAAFNRFNDDLNDDSR